MVSAKYNRSEQSGGLSWLRRSPRWRSKIRTTPWNRYRTISSSGERVAEILDPDLRGRRLATIQGGTERLPDADIGRPNRGRRRSGWARLPIDLDLSGSLRRTSIGNVAHTSRRPALNGSRSRPQIFARNVQALRFRNRGAASRHSFYRSIAARPTKPRISP